MVGMGKNIRNISKNSLGLKEGNFIIIFYKDIYFIIFKGGIDLK